MRSWQQVLFLWTPCSAHLHANLFEGGSFGGSIDEKGRKGGSLNGNRLVNFKSTLQTKCREKCAGGTLEHY